MFNFIVKYTPVLFQNILISLYNTKQYRLRHGGVYQNYIRYYEGCSKYNEKEAIKEANRREKEFLDYATTYSDWFKDYHDYKCLQDFPVLEKSDLIKHLDKIATVNAKDGVASYTGGTTGASMKVLKLREDIQERHALLDFFRASHGYKLGEKCAWFSGKDIVTQKNINKGICYRDDYINKIRFFSTFHITDDNFNVYWDALSKFAPEYIVGFPSSVYEICALAASKGLSLKRPVRVFFPTAETLLPIHRDVIGAVLGCKVVDQYASSEGAPFILECTDGGLHIHTSTGIFEVVDENMKPAQEGEVLVTSFTTKGTPLIRYRIGDRVKLLPKGSHCSCGSPFPLVEKIEGRTTDFIISPTHGKVNLGNISNCTKGVNGIIKFQIVQHEMESIVIYVVATESFTKSDEKTFLQALTQRLGANMKISFEFATEIPKEKSGKFRIVKNLIDV
ncbi:phenylacetate--CoA ligase family protein [Pseudoalteromonas sp. SG44-5]|uniref:phenylacetate--CoA ligase family protein n=1 Tax=Pseudoalteromonas sp. SG44-5 TaxID=2760960 RepID=UPI0015FBDD66|nr:phenylacetate--CoA ligase family protein [Pseudoalteromonas sp. SG44-5]MBB1406076.1 phenylacetate--CoA ligase family protein [Pseudoalteromonas sp. SG44-5]